MKTYKTTISLVTNGRGVLCLDPIMGCHSGMAASDGGCYGDCYAARNAKRRGYDFSKVVLRKFENSAHVLEIFRGIERSKSPFVRMGCSGDPSEDWEHTLSIAYQIAETSKRIVIITRHWKTLTDCQIDMLAEFGCVINTSVSALDRDADREHAIEQHERLSEKCKTALRVVTCKFNLENGDGRYREAIQSRLLKYENVIDTAFRPQRSNPFVKSGVVLADTAKFMSSRQLVSNHSGRVYLGKCAGCKDKCGEAFFERKTPPQLTFGNA